jgi:two-component system, cell cycle sensor histidine kinase PleC
MNPLTALPAPHNDAIMAESLRMQDRLIPRAVIAEDGKIVYVSEGFEQLVHDSALNLEGSLLQDSLTFCHPDEALRDQPFAMLASKKSPSTSWCQAIENGVHAIQLRTRSAEIFHFQFDWLQIGANKRFLVACLAEPGIEPIPFSADDARVLLAAKEKPTEITVAPVVIAAPVPSFASAINLTAQFASAEGGASGADAAIYLDLSDDLMIRADRDGALINVNQAFHQRLGYTTGQIAITNLIDLIAPDDRAQVRTVFMSLMRGDAAYERVAFEARVIDTHDTIHWMEWRLKRNGESVYILCRDLTTSKAHEADLTRHQQQLSEAEAIAHMGYWRWIAGEQAIAWSDEIYRIFGVTRENFNPTIDNVNTMLLRRDVSRLVQGFQRAMIEQNNYDMDFRIQRPDGEIRYIRCEGRCELDDTGDIIALFGIMQDMTDRMRTERELRDAKDSAERAYAAKSQFLANMSHELRTPLNAIIGFSEMMQRQLLGPIGTEKYLDYIDGIRQSGEHLLDLISDILDMSKIEAGKYSLDPEDINLAKITRLAVHMVEGRARDACVDLSTNEFGEDLPLHADRRAVLQIILNLLSNAVKFTEPGGSVHVTLTHDDKQITLKVADTGIGIPANMLHAITQPFEQAANHYTRAHEGTGLGLAITKELAMLHGGNLDIQSTVGVGTTVTITLPKK